MGMAGPVPSSFTNVLLEVCGHYVGCIYMFWIMVWTWFVGMSTLTGAALSAAYIIVYCVVAALLAYVCYHALDN